MSAAQPAAAPTTKTVPAKPRRRWFQFSLRSLALFMALCSVLLGAFGWRLQRETMLTVKLAKRRGEAGQLV